MDADARRLAWRCRRGMLELDLALQPLAVRLERGERIDQAASLLACDDVELWDMLVAGAARPAAAHAKLAAELGARASDR